MGLRLSNSYARESHALTIILGVCCYRVSGTRYAVWWGMSTKPRWVLEAADGRWATYDTRTGPSLTKIPGLRYSFDNEAKAESQRSLYENALGVALRIKQVN